MPPLKQLEFLIFLRGGVSGAVRRIVKRWRGLFSPMVIRQALAKKYPVLIPAPFQIQDCLEHMERIKKICCVLKNSFEKVYKHAPRQMYFKFVNRHS